MWDLTPPYMPCHVRCEYLPRSLCKEDTRGLAGVAARDELWPDCCDARSCEGDQQDTNPYAGHALYSQHESFMCRIVWLTS